MIDYVSLAQASGQEDMTVTLAISTVDSLVLASDSATTQQQLSQDGHPDTTNVWNSANKIFNLRKSWPLGAMTWGRASIGGRSIATLAKELRCRFSGERSDYEDWRLDQDRFTVAEVADRVRAFFEEHYQKDPDPGGPLGLFVGGYSSSGDTAESFVIEMDESGCAQPDSPLGNQAGLVWRGRPEAISRLVTGVSSQLPQALQQLGVPEPQAGPYTQAIINTLSLPMVFPGMPVGEAIDLADFLVDATIKFVRFTPGHPVVGGPIEIAALTKHEGFKWIKRKHHYSPHLNPEESRS
jgi:hypothetical protein